MRGSWALLLLLLACSHRSRGPDGQPLWFQVESEHFQLRAATDEPTARAASLKLERVYQALRTASWHTASEPPGKVQVILLEDDASMRRFFPRGFAGFTARDSLGHFLV